MELASSDARAWSASALIAKISTPNFANLFMLSLVHLSVDQQREPVVRAHLCEHYVYLCKFFGFRDSAFFQFCVLLEESRHHLLLRDSLHDQFELHHFQE